MSAGKAARPRSTVCVRTLVPVFLVLCLGACSGSDGERGGKDSLVALGIDDGASMGETQSALVKASDETTLVLKTGARLSVPEGAVDDDVEISMKRPRDEEALPLVKMIRPEYKAVSAPYVVKPHGQSFNKDVELSLPVGKGKPERLEVAYLEDEDDTSWEIHGKPKLSDGEAKVAVKHFSVYVLLERVEDDESDAGPAPEPEFDAGAMDAGDEVPDAGPDTATRDAALPDGSFVERFQARLSQCSLLGQPGVLKGGFEIFDSRQECAANCLFDAACPDIEAALCLDATAPTDAYQSCVLKCFSFSIVECLSIAGITQIVPSCNGTPECMDGSDEANCPPEAFVGCVDFGGNKVPVSAKCDGYLDCDDGGDEQGCPPSSHFRCDSGEIVAADAACDGFDDCTDASDEARCAKFTCRDGAQQVPQNVVCDLERDCSDGSDEDQGCLKLSCEPRGDQAVDPFETNPTATKRRRTQP